MSENERRPLHDVGNRLMRSRTFTGGAGSKRPIAAADGVPVTTGAAPKRKSGLLVPASRGRRDTFGAGARDNVITAPRARDVDTTRSRRATEIPPPRSQRSDPGAASRLGRMRPAMTFTSASSRPRLPPPREPARKADDEIMRRFDTYESKNDTLQMQLDVLTKLVKNPQANSGAEVDELKAKLAIAEAKLNSAEKELVDKTAQLHKAELDLKAKDIGIGTKSFHLERAIDNEKAKAALAVADMRELKKNLEKEKDEKRDLEKQVLEIRYELKMKDVEVQRLTDELAVIGAKVEPLEANVAQLRHLLRIAETAEKEAKVRVESLREEAERFKKDSGEMRNAETTMKNEIESLRAQLEETMRIRENEKLGNQQKIVQTEEMLRSEQSKLHSLESTLGTECGSLKQSVDHLRQELAQRNAQNMEMQASLQSQTSAMAVSNSEKNVLAIKNDALEQETRAKQIELDELQAELVEKHKKIEELEKQAREDQALRRKLHNAVQELKGNIRVFCRVRPFLKGEKADPDASAAFLYTDKDQGIVAKQPTVSRRTSSDSPQSWNFKFDHVFGPQAPQSTVFTEISELVQSALDGYRVSIFAYGQTGSGKTHTMIGSTKGDELGMIPRSVHQVFDTAERLAKDHWSFKFRASFVEIYNETCRDLLARAPAGEKEKSLAIKFNAETRESEVSGLTEETVDSRDKILALLSRASRNRATASTAANDRSSRSHSVFRFYIEGSNALSGQTLRGLLNLVDLAGSERLNMSKVRGERLRETQHINRSLSALGDVIAALANKEKHIPFRNSKLTFLLQDSLGGDSKTLMFVNVSPVITSFNESLCSLRFAAKVNACHIGTARKSSKIEF